MNEAVLATPVLTPRDDDEFWRVREFRIRKPTPSHLERGYAAALSERGHTTFEMLPGRKWYRFVHPNWGDFTVGICADLLDPTPWENLRGDILHLFLCAYNKDVDLPVRSLREAQLSGVDDARERARQFWSSDQSSDDDSFKSPPPSYPGREE